MFTMRTTLLIPHRDLWQNLKHVASCFQWIETAQLTIFSPAAAHTSQLLWPFFLSCRCNQVNFSLFSYSLCSGFQPILDSFLWTLFTVDLSLACSMEHVKIPVPKVHPWRHSIAPNSDSTATYQSLSTESLFGVCC